MHLLGLNPVLLILMGADATNEMLETAEFILGAAHRYPSLGNLKVQELKNNHAIDLEYKTAWSYNESKY